MVEALAPAARLGGHVSLPWEPVSRPGPDDHRAASQVAWVAAPMAARAGVRLLPRLCLSLAVLLLLGPTTLALADDGGAVELTGIVAAPAGSRLSVQVLTTASRAPEFTTSVLSKPDRIVVDLPGVRVGPTCTAPAFAQAAGVKRITISDLSQEAPVARLVFELAVSASRVRYRILPSPDAGNLLIKFTLTRVATAVRKPTPQVRAGVQRAATAAPARPKVPAAAPPTAPSPQPAARAPQPAAGPAQPVTPAPEPAARPPRPSPRPGAQPPGQPRRRPSGQPPSRVPVPRPPRDAASYAGWILAMLLGAAAATALWRWLAIRSRARGRRVWLQTALAADDSMQRLSALQSVTAWSAPELGTVEDLLIDVAQGASHPASQRARDILRAAFPVEVLARRLRHGSGGARVRAAHVMALHPAERAAEPLLQAASGRGRLRQAAIESLARLMCEQPVRLVLQALSDADEPLRSVAMEVIRQAGPRSGPMLSRALADPDQTVRGEAVEALALTRPEGSVQAIAHLLSDPSDQVRGKAARALGNLGPGSDAADHLLGALADPSPAVQEEAGLALVRLGGEHLSRLLMALDRCSSEDLAFPGSEPLLNAVAANAVEPLPAFGQALSGLNRGFAQALARALQRAGKLDAWIAQLPESDPERRGLIVSVLRAAAGAGAGEPILRGLDSADMTVRETCAKLLGETATAPSAAPLIRLLSRPEEVLRTAAAEGLGRIEANEATEALITLLGDPSPRVRAAAATGLARSLQPSGPGPPSAEQAEESRRATAALAKAAHDASAAVRKEAVCSLGSADPDEVLHIVVAVALNDTDDDVRASATDALNQIGAYDTLPILLVEAINSEDPALRARAVEILGHVGNATVSEPIIGALQDPNEKVRAIAGRGLWEVISSEQCQPLVQFLNSPDPKVRASIAGALGKIRSADWAGALAAAANDPSPHVRAAVVNALARIGEGAAEYLESVAARFTDTDAFVRARAVEAACLISPADHETARRVLEMAADPDSEVRRTASVCLLQFARRGVCEPLIHLLADRDHREPAVRVIADAEEEVLHQILGHAQRAEEEVSGLAMEALSEALSGRWTVDDLRPELSSLETDVRLAGTEGLALVSGDRAVEELIRLLANDPARQVRVRAAQILSARPDSLAALQALRRAAQTDPDQEVRRAAAEAQKAAAPPAAPT